MAMAEETCVNCGQSEADIPMIAWRYQGETIWICSRCIPYLIHHTEVVMAKVHAGNGAHSTAPTRKQGK
jgi:hypothetical protein